MKRRLILCCAAFLLAWPLLHGAGDNGNTNTIPLDRGGRADADAARRKQQDLQNQGKRTGPPVQDKPAADRSTLRLPNAIINIEDLSRMDVDRGRGTGSLIPTVDRTNQLFDDQPGDFRDRDGTGGKNGDKDGTSGRPGDTRTLSQMEILYGSFHTLDAFVMTGMERKLFSYQVSFRRNRDEGFDKGGTQVANSAAGGDDLVLDLGWSRDRFESGVSLRFYERTAGLQGNTNYSQSRGTGLRIDWKGTYIFSSSGRFLFSVGASGLRHVLDNPVAQATLNAYGTEVSLGTDFNWVNRSFLKLRAGVLYQNSESSAQADSRLQDPLLSVEGGFGFGAFTLSGGIAIHAPGFDAVQPAPFAKLEFHAGRTLTLYAQGERKITWLDQEKNLVRTVFADYTPLDRPEDSLRLGGGGKLKAGPFVLTFSLFYVDYSRLLVPELAANNLYRLVVWNPGMIEIAAEAHLFLYRRLSLRLSFTQRLLDETIPHFAELLFAASCEWRIPKIETLLAVTGRFEGSRNDGALDPYFLLDVSLRQPVVRGLSAVLLIRNLLGADSRQREFYQEPGFSIHGGMSLRF